MSYIFINFYKIDQSFICVVELDPFHISDNILSKYLLENLLENLLKSYSAQKVLKCTQKWKK